MDILSRNTLLNGATRRTDAGHVDIIKTWRGSGSIDPVRISGALKSDDVDQVLLLAHRSGVSNVSAKPDRYVKGVLGTRLVNLTDRVLSGADIAEMAKVLAKQANAAGQLIQGNAIDTRYDISLGHGDFVSFRVNMSRINGEGTDKFSLEIRPATMKPLWLPDLDLEDAILANLRPESGMLLITGVTNSGKSTLAAAIIRWLGETAKTYESIKEYGMPIEILQDDEHWQNAMCDQINAGLDLRAPPAWLGGEFSHAGSHVLRRAPTIVSFTEIRDSASIRAAIEIANTGHFFISTAHTTNPAITIQRLCLAGTGEDRAIFAMDVLIALRLVVSQALLPAVGGGKYAVREFVVFNDDVRDEMLSRPQVEWPNLVRDIIRKADGITAQSFLQSAERALSAGHISQEIFDRKVLGGLAKSTREVRNVA